MNSSSSWAGAPRALALGRLGRQQPVELEVVVVVERLLRHPPDGLAARKLPGCGRSRAGSKGATAPAVPEWLNVADLFLGDRLAEGLGRHRRSHTGPTPRARRSPTPRSLAGAAPIRRGLRDRAGRTAGGTGAARRSPTGPTSRPPCSACSHRGGGGDGEPGATAGRARRGHGLHGGLVGGGRPEYLAGVRRGGPDVGATAPTARRRRCSGGPRRARRRLAGGQRRVGDRTRPTATTPRSGCSPAAPPAGPRPWSRPTAPSPTPPICYAQAARRLPAGRRHALGAQAVLRLRHRLEPVLPVLGRRHGGAVPRAPTPEVLFDQIARHRPTILVNVPTMVNAMVAHPAARDAGPVAPALRHLGRRGAARELYSGGWTRSASSCSTVWAPPRCGTSSSPTVPGEVRPGTLGRAVPGFEVRVCDEDGAQLPRRRDRPAVGARRLARRSATGAAWRRRSRRFRGEWYAGGDLVRGTPTASSPTAGRADEALKVAGKWLRPRRSRAACSPTRRSSECAVGRRRGRRPGC